MSNVQKYRSCKEYKQVLETAVMQVPFVMKPYNVVIDLFKSKPLEHLWTNKFLEVYTSSRLDDQKAHLIVALTTLSQAEVPSRCSHILPMVMNVAVNLQMFSNAEAEFFLNFELNNDFDKDFKKIQWHLLLKVIEQNNKVWESYFSLAKVRWPLFS
jgi:hypothetical protein